MESRHRQLGKIRGQGKGCLPDLTPPGPLRQPQQSLQKPQVHTWWLLLFPSRFSPAVLHARGEVGHSLERESEFVTRFLGVD